MRDEDDSQQRPNAGFTPMKLEALGRDGLDHYIAALEAEIARVKREIVTREAQKGAADAMFRRP